MEILVCVDECQTLRRTKLRLNPAATTSNVTIWSIRSTNLITYAVEEALQITAKAGGTVTVVTVGGEDDEEVLRREMAMGANRGMLLSDDVFNGSDGKGIATVLKSFVQKGQYDLVLTEIQGEDGGAQVGGMLATCSIILSPLW